MSQNDPYLTLTIDEDGRVHSIQARNAPVNPSGGSLITEPLNLGDISLGAFRTIILVKLVAPDGRFTWMVKEPLGAMDSSFPAAPGAALAAAPSLESTAVAGMRCCNCRYCIADTEQWIDP